MSAVPPDIHEQVLELALAITNATMAEDTALADSVYQKLLAYHSQQLASGRCHPFVTETLADFTDNPVTAIVYYEQALKQSRSSSTEEPTQTILIGIGQRLKEMGRHEQAEAYIRDGRAEATLRHDEGSVTEADRLLSEDSN